MKADHELVELTLNLYVSLEELPRSRHPHELFLELGLDREAGVALGVLLCEHLTWGLLDALLHDLLEL